ncbi:RHS repeat domain-containing protein [Xanthomonas sacchari]|uniref:RHS repeat domain-containing protein n=1 Tax=Xanthomonas sacchari TaxID=56458 RepID=UPI0022527EEF|nr:RHS repeat-associated core domain-containing protein [Xanthomonas sacchari]
MRKVDSTSRIDGSNSQGRVMSNFQGIRAALRLMATAGLSLLVAFGASAQTVRYIHTDGLGSVVLVTDKDRNVAERSEYEPYGSLVNRPITDGPGYTAHVMDASTGLFYMQQRYYDPQIGRLLSVDPVTPYSNLSGAFNRYWYASNNPYKFIDPDGREVCGQNTTCHLAQGEMGWTVGNIPEVSASGSKKSASSSSSSSNGSWNDLKGRLGLQGDLTKNGNILDVKALAHDIFYPVMDSPFGGEAHLASIGFFALKLGPAVGSLKGLGNIGSHGVVDASVALNSGVKWLGKGYTEVAPGVYRSADGLRQFRMTTSDLAGAHGTIGSHVHFEALNEFGKVIENLHLGVTP